MSLTAKPFNPAQKLIRRIFGGKPKVFADVDLNQLIDLNMDAMHRLADRVGGTSQSSQLDTADLTLTGDDSVPSYSLTYQLEKTSTFYVYHKNCRFTVPTFNLTGTITGSSLVPLSVYLIAKKDTITFVDDSAIGGVSGGGLGSPVASSDAEAYIDERVALAQGNTLPSLSAGEEIICKLFSVVYYQKMWLQADATNYLVDSYVPYLIYEVPELYSDQILEDLYTGSPVVSNYPDSTIGVLARLSVMVREIQNRLAKFTIRNVSGSFKILMSNISGGFEAVTLTDFVYLKDGLTGLTDVWHSVGGSGEPAFGTNWSSDTGYSVKFRKTTTGHLELDGIFKATGAPGATLVTLGTDYRPNRDVLINVNYYDASGSGNYITCSLKIESSTGIVSLAGLASITPAINDLVFLHGVRIPLTV